MEDGVVKVALHSGGESYDRPEDLVREIQESDTDVLREFVRKWMPLVDAETVIRGDVCMYTMSADEHFIVGNAPGSSRVWIAGGMSGHGFKFSSVLGESLCQWICDGSPRLSLSHFSPERLM